MTTTTDRPRPQLESPRPGVSLLRRAEPRRRQPEPVRDVTTLRSALGVFAAAVGSLLALWAARSVDSDDVGGYGLIQAFPASYWLGSLVAVIGIVFLLRGRHNLRWLSIPTLIAITHLAGAVPHDEARFPVAYTHLGFVRFILGSGETEVLIDARFAWPGFFAAAAGPFSAMSETAINLTLRLWPIFVLAVGALLVNRVARHAYPERDGMGVIAALVFVIFSWTGQDYFSPQSIGFLAFLAILALVELGGVRDDKPVNKLFGRLTRGMPTPVLGSVSIALAAVLLIGMTVVSHPLSPFFIIAGLFVLTLYRRQQAFGLLVITIAVYLGWLAFAAELWWEPRIADLAEQVGDIFGSLRSSTSERTGSSSVSHQRTVYLRMLMALILWMWAGIEVLMTWSNKRASERPLMPVGALCFAPLLALPLQSYGGELLIRCFFFSSPFAAILVARSLSRLPARSVAIATGVVVGAFLLPLMATKFGNESFEMTQPEDRAAIAFTFDSLENPDRTLIVGFNGQSPWQDQLRGQARFLEAGANDESVTEWLEKIRTQAADGDRNEIRLVVTRSQDAFGVHIDGKPHGWAGEYAQLLDAQPGVDIIYAQDNTWVLEIAP